MAQESRRLFTVGGEDRTGEVSVTPLTAAAIVYCARPVSTKDNYLHFDSKISFKAPLDSTFLPDLTKNTMRIIDPK